MSALDGTIESPNFDTAQPITPIQPSKYVLEVNLHTIMSTKLRVDCQFKRPTLHLRSHVFVYGSLVILV